MVFFLLEAFPLVASLKDWNFFFGSLKAKVWLSIVGRYGARIILGILGVVFIIVGILSLFGKVDLASGF